MAKRATLSPKKAIHYFGKGCKPGIKTDKHILGGKGANLAQMCSLGLPVPPGYTITTDVCRAYHQAGGKLPEGLTEQMRKNVRRLERETGKKFGAMKNPLLLSVRSGAAISMPGMMDTVLNLGLNDETTESLAEDTGDPRFAYDAYRRLINMFGDVVMGVDHEHFEAVFTEIKKKYKAKLDTEVPVEGMKELCKRYKQTYRKHVKEAFPQDPHAQLERATEAVFRSWNAARAIKYREINEITGLIGTAVNTQTMVFGNMGEDSGTGVAFTRNPATGENKFYGEFLINAQGEDVVGGIRTPRSCDEMSRWKAYIYKELLAIKKILEKHYTDMQDIEFTIENGKLYMLQTRTGKRTGAAALRIAVELVKEGLIDQKTALLRIPPNDLTHLLLPSFSAEDKEGASVMATGLPASPGAATGKLAFTAEEAVERAQAGEDVLLVRRETSPEDVDGMHHAVGILTSTGGMTSHAAVVARGWGKCCVAGAGDLQIDTRRRKVTVAGKSYGPDDVFSIDGSTGEVMLGTVPRSTPKLSGYFAKFMRWSDQYRTLGIRTNADTPEDAQRARDFGAQGIGLTRTEHMFFGDDRIRAMREMILAETQEDRKRALRKLLPYQRKDLIGIFTAMKGYPVTVRLLDPPLHEFLPHDRRAQKEIACELGVAVAKIQRRVLQLEESNPMLGHRGCRLSVTYPEILVMQVTAIVEAMIACRKKRIRARPEIMIPLVGCRNELATLRELAADTIEKVKKAKKYTGTLDIPIGTMIEVPRAAITAGEIAKVADFFSFGTNDLTQMTFGFSRDDVNTFLPDYLKQEILEKDPFQSLDRTGVGPLVEMATKGGRATKPGLKVGICGEHGGDPSSIEFFHRVGLDYVSCSPFRVPVARLAAAQAAIEASGTAAVETIGE